VAFLKTADVGQNRTFAKRKNKPPSPKWRWEEFAKVQTKNRKHD
jgi:hypothetical protein